MSVGPRGGGSNLRIRSECIFLMDGSPKSPKPGMICWKVYLIWICIAIQIFFLSHKGSSVTLISIMYIIYKIFQGCISYSYGLYKNIITLFFVILMIHYVEFYVWCRKNLESIVNEHLYQINMYINDSLCRVLCVM